VPLWLIAAAAMLASSATMPDQPPVDPLVVHAERSAPVTPFIFDGDVRNLPRSVKWQPGDPGIDSQLGERNGLVPSGQCATVAKDVSGSCP